jgi:DNA-binding NtrC family response regulator
LTQLAAYHWPGNVRELRNAVQRAYVMATEPSIDDAWLPRTAPASEPLLLPAVTESAPAATASIAAAAGPDAGAAGSVALPIGTSMAAAERLLLLATLRHYNRHKERTAAVLGISLKTLYNRLKEYAAEEGRDSDARPVD